MGHSITKTGSPHARVCLFTDDVPDAFIALLSQVWECRRVAHINFVEQLGKYSPEHRFARVFTKLRALELVDFEKILMLDIDTLVQLGRRLEELLTLACSGQVHVSIQIQTYLTSRHIQTYPRTHQMRTCIRTTCNCAHLYTKKDSLVACQSITWLASNGFIMGTLPPRRRNIDELFELKPPAAMRRGASGRFKTGALLAWSLFLFQTQRPTGTWKHSSFRRFPGRFCFLHGTR